MKVRARRSIPTIRRSAALLTALVVLRSPNDAGAAGPGPAPPPPAGEAARRELEDDGLRFERLDPFHASFLLGAGYGRLDQAVADAAQVNAGGVDFGMSAEIEVFDLITGSASFGTLFVGDNAAFEQTVVNSDGEVFSAESGISIMLLGLSGGLRTPNLRLARGAAPGSYAAAWGFARAGYAWQSGSRGIENCVDCSDHDLGFQNGMFADVGGSLGIVTQDNALSSIFAQLCYRPYFGDSAMAGHLRLSIGLGFL